MADSISLSAYIASLRSELEQAVLSAPPKGVHFEVGKIELEIATEVSRTSEGGVKFEVLSGKQAKASTRTQVLRLELKATRTDADGDEQVVEVSGRDAS